MQLGGMLLEVFKKAKSEDREGWGIFLFFFEVPFPFPPSRGEPDACSPI